MGFDVGDQCYKEEAKPKLEIKGVARLDSTILG